MAGIGVGVWRDRAELEAVTAGSTRFEPAMPRVRAEALYAGWKRAVERARDWEDA